VIGLMMKGELEISLVRQNRELATLLSLILMGVQLVRANELFPPSPVAMSGIRWHFSLNRFCQPEKSLVVSGLKFGSSGRIRTYDQSVNSRPLYH
jgi:hypothetical protein